ncbi:MAG TPA: type II toxin-antitoxin system RelE/ParE family toxin [Caulobacteraceae bacterium]|nr:type II toxin-antitoxin system RelE/ParE family toxin [Caulobacteraceae bacterium]
MARFRRTARAEEDLIDIWPYIARDNLGAADRLLDRLDQACELLAENPRLGPARPDLAEGLRYFAIGNYLLLYGEASYGVEIVRVVHGARDLPDLLGDA